MDRELLLQRVRSYIDQSKAGLEVENRKIDFKSIWYDLKSLEGINEFLKDASAIVNTVGPDGLIIIGYNDKTKQQTAASLKDSGLSDSSQLIDLINKKVDILFPVDIIETIINNVATSIIHIPPSIDKPHVIRNYQTKDKAGQIKNDYNKIFVRYGTHTRIAGKSDLDLMYYDRKNIIPDYRAIVSVSTHMIILRIGEKAIISTIPLTIENLGYRPLSIIDMNLKLYTRESPPPDKEIVLFFSEEYQGKPIIVQPNQIQNNMINFCSYKFHNRSPKDVSGIVANFNIDMDDLLTETIELKLSSGRKIQCNLEISRN